MMQSLSDLPSLRAIAAALGGKISGGQVIAPGPGHSRGDQSMSVKLIPHAPEGFVVTAHSPRDDWRTCRDYVREHLGLQRAKMPLERKARPIPTSPADGDHKRIADAVTLFRESVDPRGSVAETYFKARRLEIDDLACRVVRFNPLIGALVALMRNIQSGAPQAVSRRFLGPNGEKLGKPKFLGPAGGAAIMLDGFDAVTSGLHIGEGLETCQTARQLGLRPCWAAGSSGAIGRFPLLGGIECLTVLAENDASASASDVETCANRWHAAEREVLINRPIGGKDLNDVIRGAA